jgi:hypothetical protein
MKKWRGKTVVDSEDLDFLVEFFLLRNIKWKINGELRRPTRTEVEIALDDMIRVVQESDESILVEIGSLLVKRSDQHIDIYVHAGALPYGKEED